MRHADLLSSLDPEARRKTRSDAPSGAEIKAMLGDAPRPKEHKRIHWPTMAATSRARQNKRARAAAKERAAARRKGGTA